MKEWIFSISMALVLSACNPTEQQEVEAIHAVMHAQSAAWNEGDIKGYMNGYWESEDLQFSSGSSITFGHASTLQRYMERYPNKAAMGVLTFSDLRTKLLDGSAAYTTGAWHLAREAQDLSGRFTLVWRKISGEWRIVADHSS